MIHVSQCIRKNRSTLSSRQTVSGDHLQTEAQWLHQKCKLTNSADTVLRWTECHWGMVCIQCGATKRHMHKTLTLKVMWLSHHDDLLLNNNKHNVSEEKTFLANVTYFFLNWVNWVKINTWTSSEQATLVNYKTY